MKLQYMERDIGRNEETIEKLQTECRDDMRESRTMWGKVLDRLTRCEQKQESANRGDAG